MQDMKYLIDVATKTMIMKVDMWQIDRKWIYILMALYEWRRWHKIYLASVEYNSKMHRSSQILMTVLQVGYDRRVRPNYGGEPVSVGVSLYVLSVGEISAKFMDFTFDMYFRYFLGGFDCYFQLV